MADDLQSTEESAFVVEEVNGIITTSINHVLGKEEQWNDAKLGQWIDTICEHCMEGLTALKKPFKYIVSCIIMQKNGAGLHSATASYWNTVTDDFTSVKWPNDKHKDQVRPMQVIVTVYGIGL